MSEQKCIKCGHSGPVNCMGECLAPVLTCCAEPSHAKACGHLCYPRCPACGHNAAVDGTCTQIVVYADSTERCGHRCFTIEAACDGLAESVLDQSEESITEELREEGVDLDVETDKVKSILRQTFVKPAEPKHDPHCDCGICAYCNGQEDAYGNRRAAASDGVPLDYEQRHRAMLIAESRGIDLDTAYELVFLRDRVSPSVDEAAVRRMATRIRLECCGVNGEIAKNCQANEVEGWIAEIITTELRGKQ